MMAKGTRSSSTSTSGRSASVTRRRSTPDKQTNRLIEQVEQIIDEGEGTRRSIIVRATSGQRTSEQLLNIAADVHRRRNLSLTARDLLPAHRDKLEALRQVAGGRLTPSARKTLNSADASLAAQVGSFVAGVTNDQLRTSGEDALRPIVSNSVVQKALAETKAHSDKRYKTPQSTGAAPTFWTSRSLALNIGKDDLWKLTTENVPIADIYPNRTLKLPRLVEVKDEPQAVLDEKASAWGVRRIGALSTWGAYGVRGGSVRVAILDTGVDPDHPDLKGKIKEWAEFDADGAQVPDSKAHDSDQHGTHCAGIVAGGDAGGNWIGVAPDAELVVGLVLKGGFGTDAQILAGIQWAIEQRVDVISMSLGGLTLDVEAPDSYTEALLTALGAGIPVITAIGNEGSQTTGAPGNDLFALAVGATDYQDRVAGFSGGRTHIIRKSKFLAPESLPVIYSKPELSAPGVAVRSSIPGKKWAAFNGTSMATPHVAGAVALLLSATRIRTLVPSAQRAFLVQDLLTGAVDELGEVGQDHRYGFGRLDVLRAIGFAKERGF